jgi:hypothetical protein
LPAGQQGFSIVEQSNITDFSYNTYQMKKVLSVFLLLLTLYYAHAQKEVFSGTGAGMQAQAIPIYQDNSLKGYVNFSQLGVANTDSFNYRITIMDKNQHVTRMVTFTENKLFLYGVAFEQDVLCLAYFKTNFFSYEFNSWEAYKQAQDNAHSSILAQFVSFDGKIIRSNELAATVTPGHPGRVGPGTFIGQGSLQQPVLLRNIPGKGFVLLYGDENKNSLFGFNTTGLPLWQKTIPGHDKLCNLLTSGQYIYALIGSAPYIVLGYHASDPSYAFHYPLLKDKKGNSLTLEAFDNDPATGNVFISGNIMDDTKHYGFNTPKDFARGTIGGVYTLNFNGPVESDVKEIYSYWNDGSQPKIKKNGKNRDNGTYTHYTGSFKDHQGNTYFYGTSFIKRTKVGSIISTIVTIPTLVFPIFIAAFGYTKVEIRPTTLLKQDATGALTVENTIAGDQGKFFNNRVTRWAFDTRSYYHVTDPETKNTQLFINDKNNTFIYSLNDKKVVSTIPHTP